MKARGLQHSCRLSVHWVRLGASSACLDRPVQTGPAQFQTERSRPVPSRLALRRRSAGCGRRGARSPPRVSERYCWIERRAAIHPPCARQNQREPVGGIRMRSTHIAGIPSHQHEIGARGVQAAIERRHLPAMWRPTAPIAPFDLIRQGNRRLGWIDSASSRLRAPQSERQGGE